MACLGYLRRLAVFIKLLVLLVARANGADIFVEWSVSLDTIETISVDPDGVSKTNCPIQPGTNWTCVFQTKDQIGSFFYFPSINFHKAAGGFGPFGPIRVNNRNVVAIPFPKPEADIREMMNKLAETYETSADTILMNGKGPYGHQLTKAYDSFTATKDNRKLIQNHRMVLVETEGSYTDQITMDSLDVHVGQSYSVLVTMDQSESDYYIVATPLLLNTTASSNLVGVGVLHYNSLEQANGPLPVGPDPFDLVWWNMTAGAVRPNPQGTFNVTNVNISQTFILEGSAVNNVSYYTVNTPLKLADNFVNGSNVYQPTDWFPVDYVNVMAIYGVSVVNGNHKGWLELVFVNSLDVMDSWHLDGFGFYDVGFGYGSWRPDARNTCNLFDPVVRSTVQVYPGGWTTIQVHDNDLNPAKERPPPDNLLLCG
ncbi:hypothetical protein MANES_07G133302v8 [Manihot esculenta]|uniref:Uncharacterized protein n=1 Tax=Manihot esculenta TaxID=3983 RepID=A0ACB7HE98_MANES|nr:hypothetical protein MANES_07G133302v8 [Manihot esculenta]